MEVSNRQILREFLLTHSERPAVELMIQMGLYL